MLSTKIFILLVVSLAIAMATPVDIEVMTGAPIALSGEQIKKMQEELQVTLNQLASGDAPHYTISKINSATVQVVAGALYKMNVDLINAEGVTKNCNVDIWNRSWMPNGIKTTIDCAGQKTLSESHSA